MLNPHIFNLGLGVVDEDAELQRLGQRHTRAVRVDMHLDDLLIVHHNHAVPDGFQVRPQLGSVRRIRVFLHDEFSAVGKVDDLVEFPHSGAEFNLLFFLCLFRRNSHAAPLEYLQHSLEDQHQALSAGVHYPCLFQHRQHIRGLFQGGLRLLADLLPQDHRVVGGVDAFLCLHAGKPCNRKDGTLGGLHHRLVCGGHAQLQGIGHGLTVRLRHACKPLGNTPEQQREDYAGVAPGTPEQCGRRRIRNLCHGNVIPHKLQGTERRPHGHGHIGACIPVRNGIYVQFIHRTLFVCNADCRGHHSVLQLFSVYHNRAPPYEFMPSMNTLTLDTVMPVASSTTKRTLLEMLSAMAAILVPKVTEICRLTISCLSLD